MTNNDLPSDSADKRSLGEVIITAKVIPDNDDYRGIQVPLRVGT
jgi:hypothetical protein